MRLWKEERGCNALKICNWYSQTFGKVEFDKRKLRSWGKMRGSATKGGSEMKTGGCRERSFTGFQFPSIVRWQNLVTDNHRLYCCRENGQEVSPKFIYYFAYIYFWHSILTSASLKQIFRLCFDTLSPVSRSSCPVKCFTQAIILLIFHNSALVSLPKKYNKHSTSAYIVLVTWGIVVDALKCANED